MRALTIVVVLLAVSFIAAVAGAQAGTGHKAGGTQAGRGIAGGLSADSWIAQEATYLSGRTVSVVCATTSQDWTRTVGDAGLPAADADTYYGFSLITKGVMHLSPYVCEGLALGADPSTRRANQLQVAWSVDVLVHESTHMSRFTYDEALTEACARAGLPIELNRLYGIAYHSVQMAQLTLAATRLRRTMESAYQEGTCPRL
jgi:hypothetical protein